MCSNMCGGGDENDTSQAPVKQKGESMRSMDSKQSAQTP